MDETPLLLVYENDDENLNSLMNMVQMEKKKKKKKKKHCYKSLLPKLIKYIYIYINSE